MTHYKIVKKTYYGINDRGEILEDSLYRPYIRVWPFWIQLSTKQMHHDGSNPIGTEVAFKHIEDAEHFIMMYHKNKKKIGSYKLETVEYINY